MSQALVDHCLELLAPLGAVRAKRMFGGYGLYCDELFFALLAADRLYLKVDASTRPAFEQAANIGVVLEEDQRGHGEDYRQAGPAGGEVEKNHACRRR